MVISREQDTKHTDEFLFGYRFLSLHLYSNVVWKWYYFYVFLYDCCFEVDIRIRIYTNKRWIKQNTNEYGTANPTLGWHFRKLFQSSKLKARTSVFTETWQKRRSSFELWAFQNVTLSEMAVKNVYVYVAPSRQPPAGRLQCATRQKNSHQRTIFLSGGSARPYICRWNI